MKRAALLWSTIVASVLLVWLMQKRPAVRSIKLAGTIVRFESGVLTVVPPPRRGHPSPERRFAISADTKLLCDDLELGSATTAPTTEAHLKPGLRVLVLAQGQAATEVRLLAAPPVIGTVAAINGNTIVVSRSAPPPAGATVKEIYQFDAQRTRVSMVRVQGGPPRQVDPSSLRVGQPIVVLAKERLACVVNIQPVRPLLGEVRQVDEERIVIKPATRPSAPVAVEQSFRLDRGRTELYHTYMGEPATPAMWEEVQVGTAVGVTLEDGAVAAISIFHGAVRGKLSAIGDRWISVVQVGAASAIPHKFRLDEHSRIELGWELSSIRLNDGHTRRTWKYVPGGRLSDLRPGEFVSVTAKNDLVLSMRVTPTGALARAQDGQ